MRLNLFRRRNPRKPNMEMPPLFNYGLDVFTIEARAKARALLWEHLDPEQRDDYRVSYSFHAKGNVTGTIYTVQPAIVFDPQRRRQFCLMFPGTHADAYLPIEDQMLAKKILIEKDEDLFLRTANGGRY